MKTFLKFFIPQNLAMFSLEGIDGSGKSTQTPKVVSALKIRGIDAVAVRSPSNSLPGRTVRKYLKVVPGWLRNWMFMLDFILTIRSNRHKVIIWDRYKDSGVVSNRDMTFEEAHNWMSVLPDTVLTFYLEIKGIEVLDRNIDDIDTQDISWQEFKLHRYKKLLLGNPKRFRVIDARKTVESITDEIVDYIVDCYKE